MNPAAHVARTLGAVLYLVMIETQAAHKVCPQGSRTSTPRLPRRRCPMATYTQTRLPPKPQSPRTASVPNMRLPWSTLTEPSSNTRHIHAEPPLLRCALSGVPPSRSFVQASWMTGELGCRQRRTGGWQWRKCLCIADPSRSCAFGCGKWILRSG